MKRRILIVLLALGTIGGFGSGIAGMSHCARARRAAMERHVAKVCVDAARGAKSAPADAAQEDPSDW